MKPTNNDEALVILWYHGIMGNTVGRQFEITKFQKDLINGSILGDARLESRSNDCSARLRIHHSERQKEFVFWKYEILRNWVSCPPKRILCWINPRDKEKYYSWYFHTLTLSELKDFYLAYYSKNKKILPRDLKERLNPMSLAVWFMDDGCNTGNSIILNTHNFSDSEHKELVEILRERFDLNTSINKDRDKFRLRLSRENAQKLLVIVSPFIPDCMKYKIVPVETSH